MVYEPQFTITPRLLSHVEVIAGLRERILRAAVELTWIPAIQKDSRSRNVHASTAIEAGLIEKIGGKKTGRYVLKKA